MAQPTQVTVAPPTDYALQQQQALQKQKLLEAMLAPMMAQRQGQMAGQVYVGGNNAGTALSQVMGAYLMGENNKRAQQEQTDLAGKYRQARDAEIQNYVSQAQQPTREMAIRAITSQYPELQSLGQEDLKQWNAENTPFMRMIKAQMGGQPGAAPTGDGAPAAAGAPAGGGMGGVMNLFPGLSQPEVMVGGAADPSGKELFKLMGERGGIKFAPDGATPLVSDGRGGFKAAPGALPAQVANVSAIQDAKNRSKAAYTMADPVETGGGVYRPTELQMVQAAQGGPAPGAPGPQTVGPAIGQEQQLPAQAAPGNMKVPTSMQQARDGDRLAVLKEEFVNAKTGYDKQAIQREYQRAGGKVSDLVGGTSFGGGAPAAPQSAPVAPAAGGVPGLQVPYNTAMKDTDKAIRADDVKTFSEARGQAQKARSALKVVGEMRKALNGGTFQDAFGTVKERATAFANALGIKVDPNKLSNSQYLQSLAQNLIIPQVKQLGFNPTDADAARIEKMVGGLNSDPKAFDSILSFIESIAKRDIDKFDRMDKHVRANLSLSGFDYGEPQAPANLPTPESLGLPPGVKVLRRID